MRWWTLPPAGLLLTTDRSSISDRLEGAKQLVDSSLGIIETGAPRWCERILLAAARGMIESQEIFLTGQSAPERFYGRYAVERHRDRP